MDYFYWCGGQLQPVEIISTWIEGPGTERGWSEKRRVWRVWCRCDRCQLIPNNKVFKVGDPDHPMPELNHNYDTRRTVVTGVLYKSKNNIYQTKEEIL